MTCKHRRLFNPPKGTEQPIFLIPIEAIQDKVDTDGCFAFVICPDCGMICHWDRVKGQKLSKIHKTAADIRGEIAAEETQDSEHYPSPGGG